VCIYVRGVYLTSAVYSQRYMFNRAGAQKVIEHAGLCNKTLFCCGLCNKTLVAAPAIRRLLQGVLLRESCCSLFAAASAIKVVLRPLQQGSCCRGRQQGSCWRPLQHDPCCGLYTLSALLGVYIVRVMCDTDEFCPSLTLRYK